MILLSRLIKSIWSNPVQSEKKVIAIKMLQVPELAVGDKDLEQQNQTPIELLNEASMEAEQIREHAKVEADALYAEIQQERDAWMQEKEMIANTAQKEGYHAGLEEGKRQGYAEYHELIEEAQQIIAAAKKDNITYLEASEKTILNLAVKIAGKIVASKIDEEESSFLTFVKRAVKEAKEYHDIQVHVHPRYYQYLLSQKEELLTIFSHETNLFIFPNEDLPEDGCVIESESGRLDASIDTQLSEIKRKLIEMLESETS
jgi:flagellar assembly protein FliH